VNASDVPWVAAMHPTRDADSLAMPTTGAAVYAASCAGCHGPDRRGDGNRVPSLVGVGARLSAAQIGAIVEHGRGFMPAIRLEPAAERAVVAYLRGRGDAAVAGGATTRPRRSPSPRAPYEFAGYERWRDSSGYPAVKPPWGTLSAIDLNTGEYRWRIPLGEHAELTARGLAATGTEQYGGPIVTAGGLLFIASTMDGKFRALDRDSGALLWEATLPAPGYATPMTYMLGGKQYVVIAAGGGKLGSARSDAYVAFALP
jgi:quinoprotein glucose dehydrogenase